MSYQQGRIEQSDNNASSQNSQWFMTSPSGSTRIVNVTENFVTVMTKRGYTFSRTDPTYTGTGRPIPKEYLTKSQVEQVMIDYYGDDIALLHGHASRFGTKLEEAKGERTSLQGKFEALNPKFDELHAKHIDQETRITRNAENIGKKADIGHKHSDNGGCAWYDIQCHVSEGFEGLGKLALIGGVAVVGIFLLKMRLGK